MIKVPTLKMALMLGDGQVNLSGWPLLLVDVAGMTDLSETNLNIAACEIGHQGVGPR
jgi:hypothetical protein